MRFSIDPWDPGYGTSSDDGMDGETASEIDLSVELPLAEWRPIRPVSPASGLVTVIDGVRRVEARLWIDTSDGGVPGVCASWAAGSVRCGGGTAWLDAVEVGRTLAAPVTDGSLVPVETAHGTYMPIVADGPRPEQLWLAVQDEMSLAERRVAEAAARDEPAALIVIDGPLRGREHLAGAIGMVKTHHVRYLEGGAAAVLNRLEAGERTPVFSIAGGFTRYSWYVRLPAPAAAGVPMAGVVRCECPAGTPPASVGELADRAAVEISRLASEPHKDRRAPQNLYPIAGLERLLRHRLGDARLLYRALRLSAATAQR